MKATHDIIYTKGERRGDKMGTVSLKPDFESVDLRDALHYGTAILRQIVEGDAPESMDMPTPRADRKHGKRK